MCARASRCCTSPAPTIRCCASAYIKARDAFQLADKFYKRAQDLYAHKVIAQADLEQAESTRTQAEADLESSEQAIRILGISKPGDLVTSPPSPEVPLLAPLAGEVVERLCSPGQLLQAGGTQCFTLSDMSSVWVLVNIYQNDVAYVHVGDEVTIDNEAYPGVVRGKIQYIAPALDPTTRTLQARIEASNPGERLKKDMYVTAEVRAGVIPNALMVPDAAVLRDTENMPYVYLQTGNNQFAQANGDARRKPGRQNTSPDRDCRRATRSSETAACSCNSRTRSNAEPRADTSHDSSCRSIRSPPAFPGADAGRARDRRGRSFVPAHAGGRLSGPFAADGGSHHAVAGSRGRGNRAVGDPADRSRDERRAAHGRDAVDFALRAFRRHHDVPGKHRRLLRAPSGVSSGWRTCNCPRA